MKITVIGRQMDVSEDIKLLIERKLGKLDKFFDDDASAHVKLSRLRNKEKLELTISNRGTLFRSEEAAETFNNALDAVMDKIERQIRKNKTKLEKKIREGAFDPAKYEPVGDVSDEEEEDAFKIKVAKTFEMRPMPVSEAILQMNLLGHKFYMFNSSESGKIMLVYKRDDGDYGTIEPM